MEKRKIEVLGLSGSLRKQSSNMRLLSFIGRLMPDRIAFRMYDGLANLPHFNPDLDGGKTPIDAAVREWREALQRTDAIVICTPEYARGVPGSLKNALDWVVSSGEFMHKPTAVLSVSPHPDGGATALHSLTLTLLMMSAAIPDGASLAVPFANSRIGPDGSVADDGVLASLYKLVESLLLAVGETNSGS